MTNNYAQPYKVVKINVPKGVKARAIQSLVPEGKPLSSSLLDILLGVAAERGEPVTEESDTASRLEELEERVDELEAALAEMKLKGGKR